MDSLNDSVNLVEKGAVNLILIAKLTIKKLMEKHSSEPFNPNIAHVYYLAGFIESWGRGIEKICQACREDHMPLPEYDITGNSVMIKVIDTRIYRIRLF